MASASQTQHDYVHNVSFQRRLTLRVLHMIGSKVPAIAYRRRPFIAVQEPIFDLQIRKGSYPIYAPQSWSIPVSLL